MQDREEKTEQQLQETIQAADEQPILISDACKQLNMEAHVLLSVSYTHLRAHETA